MFANELKIKNWNLSWTFGRCYSTASSCISTYKLLTLGFRPILTFFLTDPLKLSQIQCEVSVNCHIQVSPQMLNGVYVWTSGWTIQGQLEIYSEATPAYRTEELTFTPVSEHALWSRLSRHTVEFGVLPKSFNLGHQRTVLKIMFNKL